MKKTAEIGRLLWIRWLPWMPCVRPSVCVPIQFGVCFNVVHVEVVMQMRGEFR